MGLWCSRKLAQVMVADGDGRRKPAAAREATSVVEEFALDCGVRPRLLRSGLAQVNLEVQQFPVLFEGHDVGNVQAGAI
jgi:hypothetical protein